MPKVAPKARKMTGPNKLVPKVGMYLSIYMSRKDVGSGVREYILTKVGSKFIYLFYPPRLMTLKLTIGDWSRLLAIRVRRVGVNRTAIAERIERRCATYLHHGMKYSAIEARRAVKTILRPAP